MLKLPIARLLRAIAGELSPRDGRLAFGANVQLGYLAQVRTNPLVGETNDGFRIAEADLKLRGPGELLGQQQSGMPALRFGDLARDISLIERARTLAAALIQTLEF